MPLTSEAYLEVDRENRTGVFQLTGVEQSRSLDRRMLIGPRGQALQGTFDLASRLPFASGLGDIGTPGQGVTIDGGQGEHLFELEFEITTEDLDHWGDTSTENKFDGRTGTLFQREDVLHFFCRTAQTDSLQPGRLYWSEWTDGTYASTAGAHNAPADILVRQVETTIARDDQALTGTIGLLRTESFPDWDPGEISDAFDDLI